MITTDTWMPVTDRFKSYVLDPTLWHWDDGPVILTKGHHDPDVFLAAALEEWDAEYGALDGYPGEPVPAWLTIDRVRREWWANRMHAQVMADGYSYAVERVAPWARGAYPVTVVES